MKPQALLFDCDGVLLNTLPAAYDADRQVIPKFGGRIPCIEVYRRALGENMLNGGSWDALYKGFGVTDPESAEKLFYELFHAPNPLVIPGAIETLEGAKQMGIPISVVSHDRSLDDVVAKLTKPGLIAHFDSESVYCAEGSKTLPILAECERLRVDPRNVFFIGDTVKDVKDAKAAGVKVIAVTGQYSFNRLEELQRAGPTYIINNLRALLWKMGN